MTKPQILLVEDEPSLVLTLTDRLVAEGFHVTSCGNGDDAVELAQNDQFELIVLDVQLPGRDGLAVCRDLRQLGVETPILMLTARSQVVDRVVGLKLGADDYLTKPFEMMELLARIEALLRRSQPAPAKQAETYRFGDVEADFRAARVLRAGVEVDLSALELKLLRHFLENPDAALSRDHLLDRVWGYDASTQTRTVDVHVSSLRHKLEPDPSNPQYLVTVHGVGYRFTAG